MQSISYPDGRLEQSFYVARNSKDAFAEMDKDLRRAEAEGGTLERRTKIGRNTTCPCGSGLKFKKCCIDRAKLVGVRR